MPPIVRLSLFVVAATIASWLFAGSARTVAQEATPVPSGGGGGQLAPGVEIAFIGLAPGVELPLGSGLLALFRLTVAPGAAFPFDGRDPGTTLLSVEAGSLTGRFDSEVVRTPAPRAVPLLVPEPVTARTEFILNPGDALQLPPLAAGELRNEGRTEAVVLAASVTSGGPPPDRAPPATPTP